MDSHLDGAAIKWTREHVGAHVAKKLRAHVDVALAKRRGKKNARDRLWHDLDETGNGGNSSFELGTKESPALLDLVGFVDAEQGDDTLPCELLQHGTPPLTGQGLWSKEQLDRDQL